MQIGKIISTLKKQSHLFKRPIINEIGEFRNDPYLVLVSCILSLRTKDETTDKASVRLFKLAKTPREMIKLSEKEISDAIYPVGFYKTKAQRIKEISRVLIEKYDRKVPDDFNELLKLKGVGKKTAAITMVYGHKKADFIPVDSHVHIMSNRLGWVKTKNPEDTMDELMGIVPKKYWYDLNDLFVQFGQNICLSVSPLCSKCPIRKYCARIGVSVSR
jgi:endonuclease-3